MEPSRDLEDPEHAMTRTELLERRGYDPAVIAGTHNGNGSRPAAAVTDVTCAVCAGTIPGSRGNGARTCSEACSAEHARRRRARTDAARRANGTAKPPSIAQERPQPVVCDVYVAHHVDQSRPEPALYAALVAAGATVVRMEVAWGNHTWSIARTDNGGTTR